MNEKWYDDTHPFGCIPPDVLLSNSGLDLCHRMLAGELPAPTMGRALNFRMAEAEEGRVVFRGAPLEDHYNPSGVIHGGWAGAILDSALGCCVWTQVPVGLAYTTVEFKVNLLRPLTSDSGEVTCEANVVHMGRTIATSEATLKNGDGKLIAHGTETCAIFDPLKR